MKYSFGHGSAVSLREHLYFTQHQNHYQTDFQSRAIALSQKIPLLLAASRAIFGSSAQPDTLAIPRTTMPQQSQPAMFVKLVEARENKQYSLIP